MLSLLVIVKIASKKFHLGKEPPPGSRQENAKGHTFSVGGGIFKPSSRAAMWAAEQQNSINLYKYLE
jgi:hypothetical protein